MEAPTDKPRKKPNVSKMTKEQVRRALEKKRESNAKAQIIVEKLLEKNISEFYFLECLYDINQSHFEDIIEERSITHICGYPLCDKSISEKDIPKQKYRISVRQNKVYDITYRKSFCSNLCYNSAMYVKKQMFETPLWYREYEDVPTFHLMSMDSDPKLLSSMGEEIDVSIIEKVDVSEPPTFTSINDFARASLHDMVHDNKTNDEDSKSQQKIDLAQASLHEIVCDAKTNEEHSTSQQRNEFAQASLHEIVHDKETNDEHPQSQKDSSNIAEHYDVLAKEKQLLALDTKIRYNSPALKIQGSKLKPGIMGEIVEWPVCYNDPFFTSNPIEKQVNSPKKKQEQPTLSSITIEVETCLAEWFTLDTMIFLFGENKMREMVTDKRECFKEYINNYSKSRFYKSNSYDQYLTLCRKLNMLELADRKFDPKATQRETKPLPDYTMIQEESKRMQLEVVAHLDGKTEVPESLPEPNTSNEDKGLTFLPLTDKNSQNALRRRIVYQYLNKVLPDLLRSLGMVGFSLNTEARLLVNTFKLSAHNIMFKPIQWTLMSIILLKLLAIRDQQLQYKLEEPTAFQHMHLLLLSYMLDGGYIDRLIFWLTDIDRMLGTNYYDDSVD